ncbi:TIGR03086 family metal-binding protein [Actinokineospora auranticolor]|uniref:Uncharacterized protein (TIGR03086 family) n=1 Tax=Actinokineospora auranticolor TaxID=155976 RepID=A0A2S6GYQ9_9PSEU|nr:TIGR03086 family metal-binding protein [Actinokineospora auranticolor]PPK70369.1 uncharacterized protein (TIGR03086 family) [Actinokineospora auranticolor]
MDLRELDRRAVAATGAIIDGLTDEQLDAETPCTRWAVRDVVQHMVDNHRTALDTFGDGAPEPGADVRTEWRRTAAAVVDLFADDAVLAASYEVVGRSTNGRTALSLHFGDTLVHGWDIGTAVGLHVRIDDDLAEAMLAGIARWPKTAQVWGPDGFFARQLPVAEGATPTERLLAATGRDAAWTPAGRS